MLFFDFIAAVMALMFIERAWLKGSIFAELRGYVQAKGGRIAELLQCPFCLSAYIAIFLLVFGILLPALLPGMLGFIVKLVVIYVPAVAGTGWLAYTLTHRFDL